MSNRRIAQAAANLIDYCGRDFDGEPCPICLASVPEGHADDCPWTVLVREVALDRPQVGL